MQKSAPLRILPAVLLCAPFVLLAASYRALPPEIPMLRLSVSHSTLMASKSLFTVFRVPLMNLIHGLMAAVMLYRAPDFQIPERRIAYSGLFSTLLFTVALKSDFEAMEFGALAAPAPVPLYSRLLGFATVTTVLAGVVFAFVRGRRAALPWAELHLALRDKVLLFGLFGLYAAIVVLSILGSHRA
jgi:hypothetical protein